jgi:hypothetical protein
MFSYLGLKFYVNSISERHHNTGQQRLYEFCYILSFDLWTSYLARIYFLQGCGSLFCDANLMITWSHNSQSRLRSDPGKPKYVS